MKSPEARRRYRKMCIRQYFYGKHKFPLISTKMGIHLNPNLTVQNPPPLSTIPTIYTPTRQSVKLSTLKFYRSGGLQLSEGMRMIGEAANSQDSIQLVRISPTVDLINSIVAVVHPIDDDSSVSGSGSDNDSLKAVAQCNVAGFLWLVQVEVDADNLTFISACPGPLPSKHILVGSLKFVE